jgi:nucleotide-binding universal stress UspA family protein
VSQPSSTERRPLVASVLHPTDLTNVSDRAFAYALAISLLRRTRLTILHVAADTMKRLDLGALPQVRQTMERWGLLAPGSRRSAVFDEFGVKVSKVAVRNRNPVAAVTAYLDESPHDLVVLGTRGLGADLAVGSRAEAIAGRTRSLSLFVPAAARRGLVSQGKGELDLRTILVPIDYTPAPSRAISFATHAAQVLGLMQVRIVLFHAGPKDVPIAGPLPQGEDWAWHREYRPGPPVATILNAADRHAADLIVMATAGRKGPLDVLRGSTTEAVLREAPCPVLAVPAS